MVKDSPDAASRVFQALADPTRREILRRIARSDLTVAELSEPFPISAPAISKHLRVLESAALIRRIKDGRKRRFALNVEPLNSAQQTIAELSAYWLGRLADLDAFLTEDATQSKKP